MRRSARQSARRREEGELWIAIKRIDGGVFSVWAHDALRPGVEIEAMTPVGRFGIPVAEGESIVDAGLCAWLDVPFSL